MGKSTSFNDATKSEFSRMEQLLIQTANDAAQCLKVLKSNLAEYDTRHGLLFLNTAKSFMRVDIRAAKDLASELHHVADQIAKSDSPSETEIAAARDKVNAVSDAMIDLKKRARSYDRKNSLERTSEVSSMSDLSLTESEGSFVGEGKSSEVPSAADTVEAVVRLTLRHNFRGFAAVKHQIGLAEESLSPSFAERVMDTVVSMTNSLKGEAEFNPETKPKKSMSVLKDNQETMSATWFQKEICLTAPSRGFHLVTREIEKQLPELARVKVGMANLFIKHTSASLSINENCDPDVRTDMEGAFNRIVPESWNKEFFRHTDEGDDDMPGHIKSTLIGASVNIPITNGKFNLGTWQGIYLCEHRNVGGWGSGHQRKIVVTIQGSTA